MPKGVTIVAPGTTFQKRFDVGVFTGTIHYYDPNTAHYRVLYPDGDLEDMTSIELRTLLGTNAEEPPKPAKKPAAKRVKSEKNVYQSTSVQPTNLSNGVPRAAAALGTHTAGRGSVLDLNRNESAVLPPQPNLRDMVAEAADWAGHSKPPPGHPAGSKRSSDSQESSVESAVPPPGRQRKGDAVQRLQQLSLMERFPQVQVLGPGGGFRTASVEEQSADGVVRPERRA